MDLIDADSPAAARQAAGQLTGALSRRVEGIYSALTDIMAHFCAVLDYPDEDLDPFQTETLRRDLAAQAEALRALAATGRRGQLLARGITCALIGRPNAGKSSLLNALAGYERAIVTPIPGTTRDTLEVKVELEGLPFRLVDTAGLRDSDDPIEQLGVDRSRQALAQADLILLVRDGTPPPGRGGRGPAGPGPGPGGHHPGREQKRPARLPPACPRWGRHRPHPHRGGAQRQDRPAWAWRRWRRPWAWRPAASSPRPRRRPPGPCSPTTGRPRPRSGPWPAVQRAAAALEAGVTPDALLTDVEEAMAALGELTGKTLREDITQRIFDRFCVGK